MSPPETTLPKLVERSDEGNLTRVTKARIGVVLIATVVGSSYLLTHPYPSGAGGFYLQVIRQIGTEGAIPVRIDYYTHDGIPFAYPPLVFVLVAGLRELLGVPAVALALVLPTLGLGGIALGVFDLVQELTEDRSPLVPTLAAAFTVTSPDVLVWNLSAAGMVRAWALTLALVSVATGLRYLRGRGPRWGVVSGASFGLVVLSHPQTAAFVVLAHVLAVAVYAPTARGFGRGLSVGLVGALVASPWLVYVGATFGPEVFALAAGSHREEWQFLPAVVRFLFNSHAPLIDLWRVFAVIGVVALVAERDWYLPVLFGATVLLLGTPRLTMTAGGMLAGVAAVRIVRGVTPGTFMRSERDGIGLDARTVALALLLSYAIVGGALYATGATSRSIPQYADQGDAAAMAWVQANTDRSATLVTLGDTAEWTPYLSGRTHFLTPWGAEWEGNFDRNARILDRVSGCSTAECVTDTLRAANRRPDYLYVPKNAFFGGRMRTWTVLRESLAASPTYRPVHETDAGTVYRVESGRAASGSPDPPDGATGAVAQSRPGALEEPVGPRTTAPRSRPRAIDLRPALDGPATMLTRRRGPDSDRLQSPTP